jgi:protein-disulfide isomerase
MQTGENKRKAVGRESFGTVTVLAVIIAAVLIFMGTASASTAMINKIPASVMTRSRNNYDPLSAPDKTQPQNTAAAASLLPLEINTSRGSLSAPVTIIEYSDFQCAHCQDFALTLEKELAATYIDTGKAFLIYKFITSYDESLMANQAAACAAEQGQFWPYHLLLMELRASPEVNDLPVEKLESLAKQLGLDVVLFSAGLESRKYENRIWQDQDEAISRKITGTPTFVINGTKLLGARSLQEFRNIIDPILQKSGQ